MFLNLYIDMRTKKLSTVKPNTDNRNVHVLEFAGVVDIDLILKQLESATKVETIDVIQVKFPIPQY